MSKQTNQKEIVPGEETLRGPLSEKWKLKETQTLPQRVLWQEKLLYVTTGLFTNYTSNIQ